ncbi:hypothetical protein A2W14_03920 [Candidatus Gottesmanbacteria bacterium RBG_16_37_8]|uniref:Glycosyltransferase RgtA/B/C/D-like domain-containing protein n=1 Tax=Candidatus Gottesmanbacteria bacterium RBG_16_37_8 TaxID=1798371 RepID=A0A1F5YQ58_9BACT|nr:MAG: hypothetical protein A2W14_03920 [Candidatus Gottesmanbacteria bacterium RBG_16_37_8]
MNIKKILPFKFSLSQVCLLIILAIGAFLRFYKIRQYLTFLGDEGRDVLVVKRMLLDGKFTLLGPITSVGSIYMGPIYYYLTAPFLFLWHFDPVGPAVMVACLALVTIYIIYRIGTDYFHPQVGLVAAFLDSISRLTVIYGHSSWNPNVVPFFAVLLMFSLLKIIVDRRYYFFITAGLCLGTLIQLHYITFMFFPIILTVFLINRPKISLKYYLFGLLSFLLSYSPFILFEVRHQFVNSLGAVRFIIQQNKSQPALYFLSWWDTLKDVSIRVFWRPLVVENAEITKFLIIIGIVIFFFSAGVISQNRKFKTAFNILLIWLFVGILSFGLYRGAVYDYYFGSLFPLPHLLFGIMFYLLFQKGKLGKISACVILVFLTAFNIIHSSLLIEPNNMLKNTKTIADFVLEKSSDDSYNFALIADKNSDHAYRYFLELSGRPPVTIENPQIDPKRSSVTNQLMVVCEEKVCQPLGHPLWEIAGFGQAEITGVWDVVTVKVFRLVPYLGGNYD